MDIDLSSFTLQAKLKKRIRPYYANMATDEHKLNFINQRNEKERV